MLIIPTRNDLPHYRETVELDGVTYGLEFYWNTRALAWFLSIWDSAFTTPILTSRRITVDGQLLGRFKIAGLPPGEIMAADQSGTKVEPSLADLGARVVLTYTPAAELP